MDDMMFESADDPKSQTQNPNVDIDLGSSDSDDMLPTQQEPVKSKKRARNGHHESSKPSGDVKRSKKADIKEKETNGNKTKKSEKKIVTKKSDKNSKMVNMKLERNCLKMLEPYEDSSVSQTVKEFINDVDNVSDRGKKNYGKGGSSYFPMADGNKHLKRAGIQYSKKDTQALVGRVAEKYMLALTTRTLPHMNQDKRTTIFAQDVYRAQKSTGHAFV